MRKSLIHQVCPGPYKKGPSPSVHLAASQYIYKSGTILEGHSRTFQISFFFKVYLLCSFCWPSSSNNVISRSSLWEKKQKALLSGTDDSLDKYFKKTEFIIGWRPIICTILWWYKKYLATELIDLDKQRNHEQTLAA